MWSQIMCDFLIESLFYWIHVLFFVVCGDNLKQIDFFIPSHLNHIRVLSSVNLFTLCREWITVIIISINQFRYDLFYLEWLELNFSRGEKSLRVKIIFVTVEKCWSACVLSHKIFKVKFNEIFFLNDSIVYQFKFMK